eukprot:1547271-Amphidinium_carterae.2
MQNMYKVNKNNKKTIKNKKYQQHYRRRYKVVAIADLLQQYHTMRTIPHNNLSIMARRKRIDDKKATTSRSCLRLRQRKI